jgi:hypothetical protein
MKPTNKLLGAVAMLSAPFLTLQMLISGEGTVTHTSLEGLFDLIYMLGWMCSIIGLMRLQAAGAQKSGTLLLSIQLVLLSIANVWNIWVMVAPAYNPPLFHVLDLFWPLSNAFMLVIGIVIAVRGVLTGWRRYVVLFTGCWLPVALGFVYLAGRTNVSLHIGGLYSVLAWSLLGWMIFITDVKEEAELALAA